MGILLLLLLLAQKQNSKFINKILQHMRCRTHTHINYELKLSQH